MVDEVTDCQSSMGGGTADLKITTVKMALTEL